MPRQHRLAGSSKVSKDVCYHACRKPVVQYLAYTSNIGLARTTNEQARAHWRNNLVSGAKRKNPTQRHIVLVSVRWQSSELDNAATKEETGRDVTS